MLHAARYGRNGERKVFSDEVTGELRPSGKETIDNGLAKSRFCREPSTCMKERCQGRKRGLMLGAAFLMQSQLMLERRMLTGR